jgi:hypothetical protein
MQSLKPFFFSCSSLLIDVYFLCNSKLNRKKFCHTCHETTTLATGMHQRCVIRLVRVSCYIENKQKNK